MAGIEVKLIIIIKRFIDSLVRDINKSIGRRVVKDRSTRGGKMGEAYIGCKC